MKKVFKNIAFIAFAGLAPLATFAQADIHFSQFYETSILRNPSLTGVFSNDYKAGAYYRDQWSSVGAGYVSTLAYGEMRLSVSRVSEDYVSFGFLGYSDKAGSLNQKISSFYPAVNYSKSINPQKNSYLSVGFTGGYTQYSFDRSKMTVNNQFLFGSFNLNNPTGENITNTKMTMWDLGAGINFNSSAGSTNGFTYMIGISAYHLTQPKFTYLEEASSTQNMRLNFNGAMAFDLHDNFVAHVHVNVASQGAYMENIAGGLVTYTEPSVQGGVEYAFSGGCFYRVGDAFIPVVKLRYKNTSVAASYDVNTSLLKQASKLRGGFELTLAVTGNFSNKSEVLKKTVCPKF
jgi:type IX secretion system PorP/SprF family membrane protein